jgi:hypothetical protein
MPAQKVSVERPVFEELPEGIVENVMLPWASGVMGKARSRMEVTMPKVPVWRVRVRFCVDMVGEMKSWAR